MKKELEQKMQERFDKITFDFPNMENEELKPKLKEAISRVFLMGASDMYNELKPLVEWVDVEVKQPKQGEEVLIKLKSKSKEYMTSSILGFYDYAVFRNSYGNLIYDDVTHWRKIEL